MMHEPVFVDEITMGGDGTPAHPLYSIGGSGSVDSLQGETGIISLISADSSLQITVPFPHSIGLRVNAVDGGTY